MLSLSVGFTATFALLLIIAAFKIKHLQRMWTAVKNFRIKVFPLHFTDAKGLPEPQEDEEPPEKVWGYFYWKGPLPRRGTGIDEF